MKRIIRIAAILAVTMTTIIVATFYGYRLITGVDPRIALLFGGTDTVDLVRTADKVEAFRINGQRRSSFDSIGQDILYGCKVLSEPIPVDRETHAELAAVLADSDTYFWIGGKKCKPQPGVALRFTKGQETLDILLCFECDILEINDGDGPVFEDFDYGRARLVAVVKQLFPNDADIQNLKADPSIEE